MNHAYLLSPFASTGNADGPGHRVLLGTRAGYLLLFTLSGYVLFRPFARQLVWHEPVQLCD